MERYILLVVSWAVYFFLHSLFADDGVKTKAGNLFGKKLTYYRLLYNLVSIVGLVYLLFLNASFPSSYLIEVNNWTKYISLMIATGGVFVLKAAFKQYSMKGFLGVESDQLEAFKANGILNHIRHPIYAGTILVVIGFWLFTPNVPTLVSVCCIFVYLAIGIPLEERKLISKYGDAYREYKKNVPSLIPRFWSN